MTGDPNETKNTPKSAEGHGLTSEEARQAGIDGGNLKPGQDFVVEYGRETKMEGQPQTGSGDTPAASQPLSDNVNDDDISQRMGDDE